MTIYIGLLVFFSVVAVVALNVASGKTVASSEIHSDGEKRKFLIMIWLLPIVGTMLAMWFINKDIRKSQQEMEDDIAPAIKELGDRLKKLETRIQQKQNNQKLH